MAAVDDDIDDDDDDIDDDADADNDADDADDASDPSVSLRFFRFCKRLIGFPLFPFLPLGASLLPDWFCCKKVYPLVPERISIVPQKSLLFEPEESPCARRTFFLCKSLLLDAGVYS